MSGDLNALKLAHKFIKSHVKAGDLCIDATAGRGHDTAFLCSLVGDTGRVIAFDIQQEAIDSTRQKLEKESLINRAQLVLTSHENMRSYASADSVACICFNFGWLPGGDHSIFTQAQSSIKAIEAGLELLKPGGIMSLCIYYGRDCGYAERDLLLEYFKTIDFRKYTVLVTSFCNRPNDPPIPVFITRDV